MSMFPSFQLLELNIISAQELAPVSRKMKTYAVAWVHSQRKLTTRVDYSGGTNPTWNDKFVFRVSEDFLYADTSAVVVEIYTLHWFRDVHVGTIRVLISNLIPPNRRPGYRSNDEYRHTPPLGMRFVALQVRRPSGRPQGILNIGVGILDGSMRSLPLYTHMDSSAVAPRDLLGEEEPHLHLNSFKGSFKNPQSPSSKQYQSVVSKPPMLRRTRSDTSSMVVSDLLSRAERRRVANTKPVSSNSETTPTTSGHHTTTTDSDDNNSPYETPNIPRERYDSFELDFVDQLSENNDVMPPRSERYDDESPYRSYDHSRKTPRRTPKPPPRDYDRGSNRDSPYLSKHGTPLRSNIVASTPIRSNMVSSSPMRSTGVRSTPRRSNFLASTPLRSNILASTPLRSNMVASSPMRSNIVGSNYRSTPMRSNLAGRLILTESELGPSSSGVANQKSKERSQANDTESSILSEWSLDDDSNIEGLRSKLERWRTELPPLYDLGSSHQSSDVGREIVPVSANGGGGKSSRRKTPSAKKKKKHNRRHTEGGNGLFSCFSNLCGVECTFVCGGGSDHDGSKRKGGSKGLPRLASSADDLSYL